MNIFTTTKEWGHQAHLLLKVENEVTSTNDWAKSEAFKINEEQALYLAAHQTQGRGRYERTWQDTGSENALLSSWSFQLQRPPSPVLTARIGLAVIESLAKIFPTGDWSLKAPNDIFLGKNKVAGILTESLSQGEKNRLIIGLGINVFSSPDGVKNSGYIGQKIQIDTKNWFEWLDLLNSHFMQLIPLAHVSELQANEQTKILGWLNHNPNLKEHYSAVERDGSLVYDGQVIPWTEL